MCQPRLQSPLFTSVSYTNHHVINYTDLMRTTTRYQFYLKSRDDDDATLLLRRCKKKIGLQLARQDTHQVFYAKENCIEKVSIFDENYID